MVNSKFCAFVLLILLVGIESALLSQSKSVSDIKIIDVSELNQIINQNKGNPLLINVWATWCAPCREEFPDLVELSEKYKKNITIIGISVDDIDDLDSKVIPFLKKQNAEFENYLLKVVEPEDFINLLNKDWGGAIPATFLYNKNGKQEKVLIGKQNYELFEKTVKEVIN
jgi:thiol-disulfide isomerase/thioredoxin